ncbi:MAG: HEPN domain-containing protein [Thermomicrobiales bacterium]
MSDDQNAELYWRKAIESLAGAESELANGRFNNAVNRAYYAAFQAAIAALLREAIWSRDGRWAHTFVYSEFVGKLINRRHRYRSGMRNTLRELLELRHRAD